MNTHEISKAVHATAIKQFRRTPDEVAKALLGNTGGGFTGGPPAARYPNIVPGWTFMRKLPSLVPQWVTDEGGSVTAVFETGSQKPAAPVAEGAAKPTYTSGLVFTANTEPFVTFAAYIKASNQLLGDVAALPPFLERMLWQDVYRAIDVHMIGKITNTVAGGGTDQMEDIRAGMAKAWTDGGQIPDTIALHPNALFTMLMIPDAIEFVTGERPVMIGGEPAAVGTSTELRMILMGMEVAVSPNLADNGFALGPFQAQSVLAVREETTITVGLSGDDFTRNLSTILGEGRGDWFRSSPLAFVKGTVTP